MGCKPDYNDYNLLLSIKQNEKDYADHIKTEDDF